MTVPPIPGLSQETKAERREQLSLNAALIALTLPVARALLHKFLHITGALYQPTAGPFLVAMDVAPYVAFVLTLLAVGASIPPKTKRQQLTVVISAFALVAVLSSSDLQYVAMNHIPPTPPPPPPHVHIEFFAPRF